MLKLFTARVQVSEVLPRPFSPERNPCYSILGPCVQPCLARLGASMRDDQLLRRAILTKNNQPSLLSVQARLPNVDLRHVQYSDCALIRNDDLAIRHWHHLLLPFPPFHYSPPVDSCSTCARPASGILHGIWLSSSIKITSEV
jgi:hypothetical protein